MRLSLLTFAPAPTADANLVNRVFSLREILEEAGETLDGVWAAEHHGSDLAPIPDPLILLADLAARRRLLDVGASHLLLPAWKPRVLAERLMFLQVLTGGRFRVAVGGGNFRAEASLLKYDYAGRTGRVYALLPELLNWLAPEKAVELMGVDPGVPAPRVLVASRDRTVLKVVIGRGAGLLIAGPDEHLVQTAAHYRELGGDLDAAEIVATRFLLLADRDEDALARAHDASMGHLKRFDGLLERGRQAPQLPGLISKEGEAGAMRLFAKRQWIGTEERIAESILRMRRNGVKEVAVTPMVGGNTEAVEQLRRLRKLIDSTR